MKNKLSITKKLFIITTLVFAVFIGSTLIIQLLFFERFYINDKKNDLINTIENFKADYNKADTLEKVDALLEEYEGTSGIKIVILDRCGK